MAKGKSVAVKKSDIQTIVFDPYKSLDKEINKAEKQFGLASMSLDKKEPRFSTGLASLDLQLAGGLLGGGWYTCFGGEQSCKSTLAMTIVSSIVKQLSFIGPGFYFDYEGSFQADYMENIMRAMRSTMPLDNLFGILDDNTGNYIVSPRVRYEQPNTGEAFFRFLGKFLKMIPDKLRKGDKWYYVYENTTENKKICGGHYDKEYLAKHGKLRIPAPDGSIQAIFLVDSYPAMYPQQAEEKDDGDKSVGLQARMFAEGLKKVKSKLRKKRVVVVGINQLRQKPMVLFGSPEYEPGGEALKFYCMAGDTLLQTESGLVYAEEYYHNPVGGILSAKEVEQPKVFDKMGYSQIVSITTSLGNTLRGKPGHKVLAIKSGGCSPKWTSLSKITASSEYYVPVKVGGDVWSKENVTFDFVTHSHHNNEVTIPDLPEQMTVELAQLLGHLTGDGHVPGNGTVHFVSGDKDSFYDYVELFYDCFDLDISERVVEKENKYEVSLHSSQLSQYLSYLGATGYSRTKSVPWAIRQSTKEVVIAYLRGLFDADGCCGDKSISLSTSSKKLAVEVQQLLLNLGIVSSIKEYRQNYHKQIHMDLAYQVVMFGSNASTFYDIVGFVCERKNDKFIAEGGYHNEIWSKDCLPFDLVGWRRDIKGKVKEWVSEAKGERKYYRLRHFSEEWFASKYEEIESFRTSHERDNRRKDLERLHRFIRITRDNNWIWVKVTDTDFSHVREMTYDANMPITSTIVTSGIISHNSDVRLRAASCALSAVGAQGKGNIEEEDSVVGNGTDSYRYIRLRTYKNKLGGIPNQEIYLRLTVEDANGDATGFCQTWDTFQYFKLTGQITGAKKKFKFVDSMMYVDRDGVEQTVKFKHPFIGFTMNWMDLKMLVESSKKEIAGLCKKIGLKKPVMIRDLIFHQIQSGSSHEWQKIAKRISAMESRSRKAKKGKKEVDDDDDD